ncbi:MAG: AAA family ATPase, partial [Alistipes sp.]
RDKSISLVREVNAENGILGAVLQKQSDVENPSPDDMYKVGTAARIIKILEMPNGNLTVILNGLEKIEIKEYITSEPYFKARVSPLRDTVPDLKSIEFEALVDSIRDVALGIINVSSSMPKEAAFAIKNIDSKRGIINFICSNLDLSDEDRQALLEAPGLLARARKLLEILIREQQLVELKNQIQERVKQEIDKQQRDYYLQQQMRTIQDELGEGADADVEKMRKQAKDKNWPKEVSETFEKELVKFERLNPAVAEYSVQMTYLQLLLELPWNATTKDNLDLTRAREQLNHDHFGLDEVKERMLEHLAVIKLKGDLKSPILCLYGPPGVGKTSLGKSVAAALGRKFGRISLGGLHDEAEVRGHRRTYIGAMPGRIIQTIKRCGSSNPVIILDEVDKVMTVSNHGDPSSALLEVLDPEQNTTFHDNYIDMEYDLSKVLFIATANNIANINPALRDRMEMINISGYIIEEKVQIAL